MSEEVLVNITPMETRVALLENGATQDIHIERSVNRGIVGNIYAGKVVRVLPGMQAAFVDIGVERNGFIHVSEMVALDSRGRSNKRPAADHIADHLHEGKKIIVQVTRDPLGAKGAQLTTRLSVSTRYLVLLPHADHMGVSQSIADSRERARLQQVLVQALADEAVHDAGGVIVRSAAEGVGPEELVADLRYLKRLWADVSRRAKAATKAVLLYADLPLHLRVVRDLVQPSVQRIVIDNQECFAQLQVFCREYAPLLSGLLEYHDGARPLFDMYGVEDEIQRALQRRVDLKSGGYLVIDQTEAMTTIDVNTGSFVGKRDQAATLLMTNLEAAAALARQVRLRNLGGIIVADFIDMEDVEHRRQVHQALEKCTQRDPARTRITGVSALGLVEMTRKRTRESLERMLCEGCHVCQGRGVLKSAETVSYEIFRDILRRASAHDNATLIVLAAPAVVDRLLAEDAAHLADLEKFIGKTISVRVEPGYSQEHFNVMLL